MSHFPNAPSDYPNAGFASESSAMDQPVSSWPRTIGIISLVYAILGLFCGVTGYSWIAFLDPIVSKAQTDVDIPVPQPMFIRTILLMLVTLVLGIMMIAGSVKLLKRRSAGVRLLKTWAMFRVLLVVLAFAATILTVKSDIEYGLAKQDAAKAAMAAGGNAQAPPFEMTEQMLWTITIIGAAIGSVLVSIYPVFLMIFLSRKKITDEVALWDAPPAY